MAAPVSEITARRPRALVVDDSQIARYILSGQLKKLGFGVEVADSAEAALRQLAGPVPDVVFLDYLLPGIDGLETVSRLRGQTRTATLPVVMYTSQDGDEFAERAQAVGADDIYVKTADERRLATILGKLALLPERTRAAASSAAVLPVAGRGPQPTTASPRRRALSGKDLSRLLERSLEAHHAKLHQELLSEFAILERYEERMRRDLFSRVDRLSGLMKRRFDDSLRQDHHDRQRRRRRRGFAAVSVAASLLLASVMSVLVAWHTGQRAVALEETAASTLQAVEQNTEALVLLQREDGKGTQPAQAIPARPEEWASPDPVGPQQVVTQLPNAAELLASEIQSMGILGPIRIETTAGSFCITTAGRGLDLVGNNLSLRDCEALPVQLSVSR
jgi:CheY-like chemotaxis protein